MSYTCMCSSAIDAEMNDWESLGGSNWGCCANLKTHSFGFHLPANMIPITDYSRSHEPGRPFNMDWACAGDYAHRGVPALRARHATLLARLMASDPSLSMVCEFIGQPDPNGPVLYWAPWNGRASIKKYTGQGHDQWSHISLWRSRANERPYLWKPSPTPSPVPAPVAPPAPSYPKWPGRFIQYRPGWNRYQRYKGNDVKTFQQRMVALGWMVPSDVDGDFGPHSSATLVAFQRHEGLAADGIEGPISWARTFTAAHR